MMNTLLAILLLIVSTAAYAAETDPPATAPTSTKPSTPATAIGLAAPAPASAATAVGLAAPAPAGTTAETTPDNAAALPVTEKCYGIARAGKNECKGDDALPCSISTKDGEGYILLSAGLCERIIGGSLLPKK
jgi:uncharacterized membrane protein